MKELRVMLYVTTLELGEDLRPVEGQEPDGIKVSQRAIIGDDAPDWTTGLTLNSMLTECVARAQRDVEGKWVP